MREPRDRRQSVEEVTEYSSDPLEVLTDVPETEQLTADEAEYVQAARAANTLRGYRTDWQEFTRWCTQNDATAFPASAVAISQYLTFLARHDAKVGTISRRLSAIRFAHQLRDLPDPTKAARVIAVWEGIRRTHGAPPDQASPLMPPELWEILDAIPKEKVWKTHGRAPEQDLAGLRDRAVLLVGFVGALRRSEIVALDAEHIKDHPNGLVLHLPRSKTNQHGDHHELVVLPRAGTRSRCPVTALHDWLAASDITEGPVFRAVSKGNRVLDRRLIAGPLNTIVKARIAAAGITNTGYSAHSLRAGFVTYTSLRGASDHAIAHQSRHRSLASVGIYRRIESAWTDNAATQLGF